MLVRLVADRLYVVLDVAPVAAERLTGVDDHVDFDRAIAAGQFGFVALRFGAGVAMREADHTADLDPVP